LKYVIDALDIKDGMTISFHHHFRNGDLLADMVLALLDKKGAKNITIFPSSLTTAHDHFGQYIQSGLISRICTSGIRDRLGEDISSGILDSPVIIRSHGGRARAIESGEEKIDIALKVGGSSKNKFVDDILKNRFSKIIDTTELTSVAAGLGLVAAEL